MVLVRITVIILYCFNGLLKMGFILLHTNLVFYERMVYNKEDEGFERTL